jgi:hypothetical protein
MYEERGKMRKQRKRCKREKCMIKSEEIITEIKV